MKQTLRTLFLILFFFALKNSFGNNAIYEQRRLAYVDSSLAATAGNKIVLQAYKGVPVDTALLNAKLHSIFTGQTSDFDIIELVRVLNFSNGAYDTLILPVLNSVPYWINYGDTVRNYWSENHRLRVIPPFQSLTNMFQVN